MSRCSIAPSAIRDLDSISSYFFGRNIEAGEQLLQEFTKKCKNLAAFPAMGKSYSLVRVDLRGLPLKGYIILYRLIGDGVEIVRAVSARQDLEGLFEQQEE
jgi:toxin ParE1/3/4